MTLNEIALLLGVIKVAYPNSFKDMPESDRMALIKLWERQFAEYDYKLVERAIDCIIASDTNPFMPSIGRIKEEIVKLTQKPAMTEQEAWALIDKATRNGIHNSGEEFRKLPPELQRLVGSPAQLREWAMTDSKTLSTVIASNFMRSYRARIQSEKEFLALPNDIKQMLGSMTGKEKLLEGS